MPPEVHLPTKDGVGPSCIVLPDGPWPTVGDFLAHRFPHISRHELLARMQRGDVLDANGIHVSPGQAYHARVKLYYYRHIPEEPRVPFEEEVLFQDEHIVAVDKPHFLPVTPGGRFVQETVLVRLKRRLGIDTLAPMHRIDRETAGVVLFTIQPQCRGQYQRLFMQKAVGKCYEAIAPWRADLKLPMTYRSRLVEGDSFMRMAEAPGEPNAETQIELLEINGDLARYRLRPLTGKKHQLRVHLAALGIPIVNDRIYPYHFRFGDEDFGKPLQLLAQCVAFRDPVTGEERRFESARRLARFGNE